MPAAVRSVGEIVDRRISSNWCVAAELPRCGPAERPGGSGALSCRGPLADLTRRRRALQGGPGATERGGVTAVKRTAPVTNTFDEVGSEPDSGGYSRQHRLTPAASD